MPSTRRDFIKTGAAAAIFSAMPAARAAGPEKRFKIGACDWSIGAMADPRAMETARNIGLDGVQISLGTVGDDMHLRDPGVQKRYKDAAASTGREILSLAIGELNNIPYKSDPRTIRWVDDAIDACKAMGCRVILLAFFGNDDLRDDPAGVDETVRRLKTVAPKAEKAGVILGIESWLSAEDNLRIVDRVGSSAVKVYYDVANSTERGYDVEREIRSLGKRGMICEFHFKENGFLLGEGRVDFQKVRAAVDSFGFRGNIQIEGGVPPGADLVESCKRNLAFVRNLFVADA
jgi:L-ribulose-5-phosphate 3-epimerase